MIAVTLHIVRTEGKHNPEKGGLITNTEDSNHRKGRHKHRGFEPQEASSQTPRIRTTGKACHKHRGFELQEGSSQTPRIPTTGRFVTNTEDSNLRKAHHKHRGFEQQEGLVTNTDDSNHRRSRHKHRGF